jgi:hypothetical protein
MLVIEMKYDRVYLLLYMNAIWSVGQPGIPP